MSIYSEDFDYLPPHLKRAWYTYRAESLKADTLWSLLDRAAEVLSRTNQTLSAELEGAAEVIAGQRQDELWESFMAEHEGWDQDPEDINMTRGNSHV
jgi:hypothetical protein